MLPRENVDLKIAKSYVLAQLARHKMVLLAAIAAAEVTAYWFGSHHGDRRGPRRVGQMFNRSCDMLGMAVR